MNEIVYRIEPRLAGSDLRNLFATAWKTQGVADEIRWQLYVQNVLSRSLTYICGYDGGLLVGFANVAWDGGFHGFILDTTVHSDYQRKGIGANLMSLAAQVCRERGIKWLHVDFEPQLLPFYRKCGYQTTEAGLLSLSTPSAC